MTKDTLFDAITEVKDQLLAEAVEVRPGGKRNLRTIWLRFGAAAAALAVVVGLGTAALGGKLPGMSHGWGPSPNDGPVGDGPGGGGAGHDGGTVFMSYAGPVFPLTTVEGGEGLTADRALTYDFSPWTPVWVSNEEMVEGLTGGERESALKNYDETWPEGGYYSCRNELLVTDSYTLSNPAREDKTVKVLYPFVSSLYELGEDAPVLTLDGGTLEAALRAGGYSGGFQTVYGAEDSGLLNLEQLNSWEQYRVLLADGSYQKKALEGWPDLSGVPVTVYEFKNYWGPEPDHGGGIPNPTIRAGFTLDRSRTRVLSYGFNGYSFDTDTGEMIQAFSIPRQSDPEYGQPRYLIVLGDDIEGLSTRGYATGGFSTQDEIEAGVDVERYAADLDTALRKAAELLYSDNARWRDAEERGMPEFELYFGLMKDYLLAYGQLSEDGPARYDTGVIGELDFAAVDRVFYLEGTVTVPAGGSVTVEARFAKSPSFDFYCAHTENQEVYGYDLVTTLGSTLDFTAQTAKAVNTQGVEIVRQNYGFDWENGVDEVALDPAAEHYYLEVRRWKGD